MVAPMSDGAARSRAPGDAAFPPDGERWCDVVMKGGVTSGVVYPPTVMQLSRRYRFKNIGGASAGAIAAGATAAAEYARRRRPPDERTRPIESLGALWEDFRGEGFLAGLFGPEASTRGLHRVLFAALRPERWWVRALRAAGAFLFATPWGLAPTVALCAVYIPFTAATGYELDRAGAAAFLWAVAELVAALFFLLHAARCVAENGFGLSSGMGEGDRRALTPWLHARYQQLAGLDPATPLTFGHLWGDGDRATQESASGQRDINLEVIVTSLNELRPYRLPFAGESFHYDPDEWARLFPREVMAWIDAHAGDEVLQRGRRLRRLPPMADLPILVAVRMSLSFPLLVSAVPLWAATPTARDGRLERLWFSDGGIACNFPIHLFDQLLPRWPTFGINLVYDPPGTTLDDPDGAQSVSIERDVNEHEVINHVDTWRAPRSRLLAFVAAILETMQGWQDHATTRLPGYRERIARVRLLPSEGGLNFHMSVEQLRALWNKGAAAGRLLVEHFAPEDDAAAAITAGLNGWERHQLLRFRVGAALLERLVRRLDAGFDARCKAVIARAPTGADGEGAFRSEAQREAAVALVAAMAEQARRLDALPDDARPEHGAPSPRPELRGSPRTHG